MPTFINKSHFPRAMNKINVEIFIDRENKNQTLELGNNSTIADLLKKLHINPVTVIVSRNNVIILEDEKLNGNDKIKILSVISGG